MLCAVRLLYHSPYLQAAMHDEHGRTVEDPKEEGQQITERFGQQF